MLIGIHVIIIWKQSVPFGLALLSVEHAMGVFKNCSGNFLKE